MAGRTARRRVLRIRAGAGPADGGQGESRADLLAVEEPLEIRVHGEPLSVTMRTPGDDIDLAAGFLAAEGVVAGSADLTEIRLCDDNTADVTLTSDAAAEVSRLRRNFLTTSACGVCGKDSIEAIRVRSRYDVAADPVRIDPAVLAGLPGTLREAQRVFASTGGLHAAGLFQADGTLLALREDVGRHNAVDKIVGWALREHRLPLTGCVLLVSGRASFELTQKALVAGIPVLAAVSAPSSLAAELAAEAGMTLIGFLRGETMNVYTGAHRLPPARPRPTESLAGSAPRSDARGTGSPPPG
jgi:FdhD protein